MVYLLSIYSGLKIVGNALAHTNRVLFISANSVNGITSFYLNLIVDSFYVNSCSNYLCAIRASCTLVVSAFDMLIATSNISSGKSLFCKGAGPELFLSLNKL